MPHQRVCPFWVGYLLASPLRKIIQHPRKILGPYVRPGMTVLDVGSAMGYFSLPLARLVTPGGRVLCVDMQEKMLQALERRARRSGDWISIEARPCTQESLGLSDLDGTVDFALAFAVVHEVPDPSRLFDEIRRAMKPGALLLVAEPTGHVSAAEFEVSVSTARGQGFSLAGRPGIIRSRTVLLRNAGAPPPR